MNATKFGGMMPRAGKSVNYQYDALGRRVSRQDKKSGKTEFTHDGLDVIQDRFQKSDGTNSITSYVNGLGIDNKLKVTSGSTSKYFLTDHLGSTVGMSDSNGSVTESATYDSFGRIQSSNLTTRYQYTGREQDEATGLMYYRARFYDPQVRRFTSDDPIGFAGGDVNLYGYVWNSPQNYTDPLGLDGWGNDLADWMDERIRIANQSWQYDEQEWVANGINNSIAQASYGFSDMFRIGSSSGQAYFTEDENGYGRAAFYLQDVVRFSGLFSLLAGGATRVTGSSRISSSPCTNRRIPWDSWENYPKAVVDGQEYAVVGNRLYSHHAVDRMQPSGLRYLTGGQDGGMPQIRQTGGSYDYGRGVPPQFVDDVIRTTRGIPQANGNISHTSGTLQVIVNQRGDVVTIITH